MPAGVTLGQMVTMLRAEIGESTNQQMGLDQVDPYYHILRRIHNFYYNDFDWPSCVIDSQEQLLAGERYYTFNNEVDYNRIFETFVQISPDIWKPLAYGITPLDYNAFNSDAGVTSDPVLKWNHYQINQFEIWPIPAVDRLLRFRCIRNPSPLIASTDVCDLDADMIVLFAAAELLARSKSADAQVKLGLAQQKYALLKGQGQKVRSFTIGGTSRQDPSGGRINYWNRYWAPYNR